MITGLNMNSLLRYSYFIPLMAEYFLRNEFMMVLVVIISTLVSSSILWNVPAS